MSDKILYLKYSDGSETSMAYEQSNAPKALSSRTPVYKGWYVQKQGRESGNPVPVLLKM